MHIVFISELIGDPVGNKSRLATIDDEDLSQSRSSGLEGTNTEVGYAPQLCAMAECRLLARS